MAAGPCFSFFFFFLSLPLSISLSLALDEKRQCPSSSGAEIGLFGTINRFGRSFPGKFPPLVRLFTPLLPVGTFSFPGKTTSRSEKSDGIRDAFSSGYRRFFPLRFLPSSHLFALSPFPSLLFPLFPSFLSAPSRECQPRKSEEILFLFASQNLTMNREDKLREVT